MPNYTAVKNSNILHATGLKWQPLGDVHVAVVLPDRRRLAVVVPAAQVRYAIRKAAAEEQFEIPSHVGDVELIGWFGSKLWKKAKHVVKKAVHHVTKAAKSVARKAYKVAKKVVKHVKKAAWTGAIVWRTAYKYAGKPMLKFGQKIAQSKEFGALLAASAIVCPAIGGPAMAAYVVANRAAAMYRIGGAAAKTVSSNVKRLAHGKRPTLNQRMLKSAFRSIAA
jgi:hypothetical protein